MSTPEIGAPIGPMEELFHTTVTFKKLLANSRFSETESEVVKGLTQRESCNNLKLTELIENFNSSRESEMGSNEPEIYFEIEVAKTTRINNLQATIDFITRYNENKLYCSGLQVIYEYNAIRATLAKEEDNLKRLQAIVDYKPADPDVN